MTTLAEKVPPEFWPTIDRLDQLSAKVGGPQVRETLEKIALFNPDAIRAVIPVWGADGADGLPDGMGKVLNDTVVEVTSKIGDRWEGESWDAFSRDMAQVQSLLSRMGEPGSMVGDQLKEFVDAMEVGWLEIVGIVLAVAGLVVAILASLLAAGGGGGPVSWVGAVLEVIGYIIGIVGLLITMAQTIVPRVEAAIASIKQFRAQMDRLKPGTQGGPSRPPSTWDWEAKTADPDN